MVEKAQWNPMGRAGARPLSVPQPAAMTTQPIAAIARERTAGTASGRVQLWQTYYTDDGTAYYYNVDSGESSWIEPVGELVQILTRHENDKGHAFWFNTVTGESTWDGA